MTDTMRFTAQHAEGAPPEFEALAALVDGRLSDAERAAVLAHLSSCSGCRSVVAELTRAGKASRAAARSGARWLAIAATLAIAAGSGALYVTIRAPGAPVVAPVAPSPTSPQQPSVPPPSISLPAPGLPSAPPAQPPRADTMSGQDRTRDAGTRSVGGKTFRLAAGEWIDSEYRLSNFLPEVDIHSLEDFAANPALEPYAPLGRKFTVVVSGTVYRVVLPPTER